MGGFTERLQRARRAYARGGADELITSARRKLARAIAVPDGPAPARNGGTAVGASAPDAPTRPAGAVSVGADGVAVPMSSPYQIKLLGSLEERWRMIEGALPTGAATVLDIGSNLGDIAARCAEAGLWTVGVDVKQDLVDAAQERHRGTADLAFMLMDVDPDSIERLPEVDVLLLLSVHHHWYGQRGPDVAGRMLRRLTERTRQVVVFESSSRRERFGDHPPDFTDNDEASVTAYHQGYLERYVGDLCDRIVPLGSSFCVAGREPYRWSWALYR